MRTGKPRPEAEAVSSQKQESMAPITRSVPWPCQNLRDKGSDTQRLRTVTLTALGPEGPDIQEVNARTLDSVYH
jgi:hypothetical protein